MFTGFSSRYPKPVFCYLPSAKNADLIRTTVPTYGSGESIVATPKGVGWRTIDQASSGVRFASLKSITSENWTMLAVANPTARAEVSTIFSQMDSATGKGINLVANADKDNAPNSGKFAGTAYSGSATGSQTTGNVIDGAFHVFAATRVSGTATTQLWVDGIKPAQSGYSLSTTLIASTMHTQIGNNAFYNSATYSANSDCVLAVSWNEALSAELLKELGLNPWLLFAPLPTRRYSFLATVLQYARPASDIATGGWLPSSGGDLYAMLDETSADDGDYIYSPDNPTSQQFEVKLGTITDPAVSTGHTIRFRLQAINLDTNFDLDLVQGTTVLDSWTESVTVAAGVVQRERTLSGAVADSITDYSNLRVRGVARA